MSWFSFICRTLLICNHCWSQKFWIFSISLPIKRNSIRFSFFFIFANRRFHFISIIDFLLLIFFSVTFSFFLSWPLKCFSKYFIMYFMRVYYIFQCSTKSQTNKNNIKKMTTTTMKKNLIWKMKKTGKNEIIWKWADSKWAFV